MSFHPYCLCDDRALINASPSADRELEAFLSNISAELPGITEPEPTAPPAGSKPAKRSLATVDAIAPISLKIGKIGPDKRSSWITRIKV